MSKKNRKVIAIIPARGGSKGIKLKNIAMLGGKTLIEHTIRNALDSGRLDRIIVSTDNTKISRIASRYKKYGIEIFKRPKFLAGDRVSIGSVLKHVLHRLKSEEGYVPDAVVTLQPTSPFRKSYLINKALELFFDEKSDSLLAICRVEHTPYKMFFLNKKRLKKIITSRYSVNNNRQLYPAVYRESGSIYVTSPGLIIKKGMVIGKKPAYFIVDNLQSFDIDEPLDLYIARILYERI